MFGDVGEPDPVGCVGTEDALDVIVEHRRTGLAALPTATSLR